MNGIETTILMPGVFTSGTAHFANAGSSADTARTAAYERLKPNLDSSGEDTSGCSGTAHQPTRR